MALAAKRSGWAAIALLAFVLGAWLAPSVRAEEKKAPDPAYRVTDPSQVYVGNPRLFKKPCAVSSDKVYRAIPEYREILEQGLTDKDVRYHFLMKKASEKFGKAVGAVSKDLGYDLVAGTGAVEPANDSTPAVPDETDAAIARLPT